MKFTKRKFLIVLSAPSGGGKSTIADQILEESDDIVYSISFTTRNPRGDEQNGVDYFFVDEDEFKKRIGEGEFLEYAHVHSKWYGTSQKFIQKQLDNQKHVIMDIDVQGAEKIKKSNVDMISIFILPPNPQILESRLRNRGTDSDEEIQKRLNNAKAEINEIHNYDYLVINDSLEDAVNEVKAIIKAEENKTERYTHIHDNFFEGATNV